MQCLSGPDLQERARVGKGGDSRKKGRLKVTRSQSTQEILDQRKLLSIYSKCDRQGSQGKVGNRLKRITLTAHCRGASADLTNCPVECILQGTSAEIRPPVGEAGAALEAAADDGDLGWYSHTEVVSRIGAWF